MKLTIRTALLAVLLAGCGAQHRQQARPVHTVALTTDVPAPVLTTCGEAAQDSRIRIVCPPVVPAGGVTDHGRCSQPGVIT